MGDGWWAMGDGVASTATQHPMWPSIWNLFIIFDACNKRMATCHGNQLTTDAECRTGLKCNRAIEEGFLPRWKVNWKALFELLCPTVWSWSNCFKSVGHYIPLSVFSIEDSSARVFMGSANPFLCAFLFHKLGKYASSTSSSLRAARIEEDVWRWPPLHGNPPPATQRPPRFVPFQAHLLLGSVWVALIYWQIISHFTQPRQRRALKIFVRSMTLKRICMHMWESSRLGVVVAADVSLGLFEVRRLLYFFFGTSPSASCSSSLISGGIIGVMKKKPETLFPIHSWLFSETRPSFHNSDKMW